MEVIFQLDEIETTARQILTFTAGQTIFAIHGEMGAGKTTFIHAFCEAMGVMDNISSPTFSIINQYKTTGDKVVCHIDLYRLKGEEEAISSGVEDCLYSGNTCLVEWPEIAPGIFPADTVHLYVSAVNSNTRKIKVELNNNLP